MDRVTKQHVCNKRKPWREVMYKIVLASNSPRRKEILEQVGIKFQCIPSELEEISEKKDAIDLVEELASNKATDVMKKLEGPVIVIGADTVVTHNGNIMGKPKSAEDARDMLKKLQGSGHEVYTGVVILVKEAHGQERKFSFADVSKVIVNPMTDKQINDYIASGEPFDKAGAYAIQGKFAIHIKEIIGDYYNIVGLPISKIYSVLQEHGIDLLG